MHNIVITATTLRLTEENWSMLDAGMIAHQSTFPDPIILGENDWSSNLTFLLFQQDMPTHTVPD